MMTCMNTLQSLSIFLWFLIYGTSNIVPHKQAKTTTNELKAHQNDANASLAHWPGDSVLCVKNAGPCSSKTDTHLSARLRTFMCLDCPLRSPVA
jgi:hypothetical protein